MIEETVEEPIEPERPLFADGERLSLGVAARLSRYLQVLTQARKMGRETISSQELSDYTHINPTQIRRDLSGFGKFGKRGVGYNVESLVGEIRKILRTSGQHNIALFGAGNLGQAIASSDIFADHGFQIVAMFDVEPSVVGMQVGRPAGPRLLRARVGRRRAGDRRRRPRRARRGGPGGRRPPGRGRREDHLQLLRAAAPGAARGHGPHLQPGGRPPLRALLLSRLAGSCPCRLDLDRARETSSPRPTSRSGSRRSSRSSTRRRSSSSTASRTSTPPARRTSCSPSSAAGELIDTEIEIRSGRGETFAEAVARPARAPQRALFALAEEMGLALGATGTHPWADYLDQRIIDTPHYNRLRDDLGWVAQRNNTWSLHVHIGVRGADRAIAVCDWMRELLPILLAASANSPFLDGRDTGLHSVRTEIFTRTFPRCGVPEPVRRLGQLRGLRRACWSGPGLVVESTQLWWSVRPHHRFGTVEVRICDAQTRGDESIGARRADRRLHRPDRARLRRARLRRGRAAARATARSRRTSGGRSATGWAAS